MNNFMESSKNRSKNIVQDLGEFIILSFFSPGSLTQEKLKIII